MSGLFSYTLIYTNLMGELQRNSWIILVEGDIERDCDSGMGCMDKKEGEQK